MFKRVQSSFFPASNPDLRIPKIKDDNDLRQAITRLNIELDKLEIEISYIKDEISGKDLLAIVRTSKRITVPLISEN